MGMKHSAGFLFRQALLLERPLQIVGTINAFAAIMAQKVGFRALYLSGAGVANASYGLPDLGVTTLDNVLTDASRIISAIDIPLLVDIDTGWGSALMIARTIRSMESAGVAAVHIEDQSFEKRCGHLEGKSLVSIEEMQDRIKAAVDARSDENFIIMARTDAYTVEGLEKMIERSVAYEEVGADMHFLEALSSLEEYEKCKQMLKKPILANITEFGKTPLFSKNELSDAGVDLILYPLSTWRAMNFAALHTYREIRSKGTQKHLLDRMQTRSELYQFLKHEVEETGY